MVIALALFVLGAVLASFVGVIVERVYTGQSWKKGRSRCDSCTVELEVCDLVPILSWLATRGRCRSCKARVSALHILQEVVLATLFVLVYLSVGLTPLLPIMLIALVVLQFIVLYDLKHTVIPTEASIVLLLLSFFHAFLSAETIEILVGYGLTAVLIGGAFFLLYFFSKGRAMGLGDAPLAFSLSLLVAPYALSGLLFSFWIGGLIGIAILVLRRGGPKMGIEVPFAPFLAAGYLLAYFVSWDPLLYIV
jgi:prepilin signal peptidase PulO-like enzyme (type II secretory pathway)